MRIRKCAEVEIDLEAEKKRIKSAFTREPEIKKKLLKLIDLVEQEKWKEAEKFLDQKWWKSKDKKRECSRYEFIGLVPYAEDTRYFDPWASIDGLVYNMANHPEVYSVVKKDE